MSGAVIDNVPDSLVTSGGAIRADVWTCPDNIATIYLHKARDGWCKNSGSSSAPKQQ